MITVKAAISRAFAMAAGEHFAAAREIFIKARMVMRLTAEDQKVRGKEGQYDNLLEL